MLYFQERYTHLLPFIWCCSLFTVLGIIQTIYVFLVWPTVIQYLIEHYETDESTLTFADYFIYLATIFNFVSHSWYILFWKINCRLIVKPILMTSFVFSFCLLLRISSVQLLQEGRKRFVAKKYYTSIRATWQIILDWWEMNSPHKAVTELILLQVTATVSGVFWRLVR